MQDKPNYDELESRIQKLEKALAEKETVINELEKDRLWFKSLYEKAPLGYQSLDKNGNFLEVNKAWLDLLGYSREEVIGKSFGDFLHPEWRDHFKKNFPRFKAVGEILGVEFEIVKKNGTHILVSFNGKIGKNAEGDFLQTHCMFRNITEEKKVEEQRKQAEEALIASEMKFRAFFEQAGGYCMILDPDTAEGIPLILDANDAACAAHGYTREEFIGRPVADIDDEDGKRLVKKHTAEIMTGEPFCIENTHVRKDGSTFPVEVNAKRIDVRDGKSLILTTEYDISERKRAEESLRESHEKYKTIVDNVGIGIALISPAMEILEINNQMREWFPGHDLDKRPICYRTFNNPPREGICDYCPTCKTLEDGKVHEGTTVTPHADKTRNYHIVTSPLINAQGEVTAAIELVEDITDRLSLQAQLIQAQKMESIGRLAGGVAHDYNNISSIIIGFSELALNKVEHSDPLHDDLIEILTAAKRSTDITRQLLAFARQQTIAPKILDLNDTIENMLKMLRRLIGEDIDLAWLPGAEVWPIKMDPSQVDQIMANLCINARDAIADVGKVTVETKNISFDEKYCAYHRGFSPGEYVLLAVSDDGRGIAPELLDKIFEPFYTTKGQGKGTGLGLSTVYGIVKQNSGFINVYSEQGKGTTIKVYLSRYIGQAVAANREEIIEIPLSCGETVLLVEDDGSILNLGKRILEGLGYIVLAAATPTEAFSLAEEHAGKINLLITDVVMPGMNGRELSEQLQKIYPNIKILFMSGYTADVIARRGILDDGLCFIPKPFSKKDMAVKVREVLDGAKDKTHA